MRIVLATCQSKPAATSSDGLLAAALERGGAEVVARPWDEIDPAGDPGIVCLRSTWDYHHRLEEFRSWVRGLETRRVPLWNPAETVLWNADKIYLRELAEAGIALPRTAWFEPGRRPEVDGVMREWGLSGVVVKPRVSATAYGTHRVVAGERLDDEEWRSLEASGCLIQEFIPEVASKGEVSLVYLDGTYSHAVLKRPAGGDFRVQTDFGGSLERVKADGRVRAFGDAVLAAFHRPWLYARVDLVDAAAGPVLMELELIEPDLFLEPAGAERLAAALLTRGGRAAA
jgi:glutathione synthase/RimK-type ligase-like ATP-grasp enzyme